MKRIKSFITLFFLFVLKMYSNDTLIQHKSGGNEWISGKSDSISIEQEKISIDLFENFYRINIEYIFRNDGETIEYEVGFPETDFDDFTEASDGKIRNFETSVNGEKKDTVICPADILINDRLDERIYKFYSKNVLFKKNEKTKININYEVDYSKNTFGSGYLLVDYLLGSAICWKKLEQLKVQINFQFEHYYLDEINFDRIVENNKPVNIKVLNNTDLRSFIIEYNDVKLTIGTKLKMYLHNDYFDVFGLPWDYNFEYYVYPSYCFELLTNEQLRKSRNLIYAFHGYSFKSKDLREFFGKWDNWYKPTNNFSEAMFNENEKKNLELIQQEESRRNK